MLSYVLDTLRQLSEVPTYLDPWFKTLGLLGAFVLASIIPLLNWREERKKVAAAQKEMEENKGSTKADPRVTAAIANPMMSAYSDIMLMDGLRQSILSVARKGDGIIETVEGVKREFETLGEAIDDLRRELRAQRTGDAPRTPKARPAKAGA